MLLEKLHSKLHGARLLHREDRRGAIPSVTERVSPMGDVAPVRAVMLARGRDAVTVRERRPGEMVLYQNHSVAVVVVGCDDAVL